MILAVRSRNDTDSYNGIATIIQTYEIIEFIVNNILFLCLLVYKYRKKADTTDENFHEPIFNQLFYNCAVCLAINDICTLCTFVIEAPEEVVSVEAFVYSLLATLDILFMFLVSVMFAIITVFSFLASIQRIIILHIPNYKYLVIGNCLQLEICLVYVSIIHYSVIVFQQVALHKPLTYNMKQALYIYNIIILAMSLISGVIYFHIYRILRKLKTGDNGTYFLYQFVPIHTILLIHSVANLVAELLDQYSKSIYKLNISMLFYLIFVPNIPGVVSLSYIVSQKNFRHLFTRIALSMWREISS
ncbi:hypothetical protein CRE_08274 [Caenorhabditis remanei]|uniref:G-protein coupled receptors family 1 profile domain-containing protein n=1 Tax=Caenorhabditis remanei TaxID=31234 RepID=E3M3E8_CAERE|nr:hypothetical protein CRE_08274 [Caenorhabditis remanei]